VLPLLTFKEHKLAAIDIHITKQYVIMNEEKDELSERYFAIIEEMIKE